MKILNIGILFMFIYSLDQNIFWLIDKIILYHTYFHVEALPVYKYNSTCFSICTGRYCPRSNHWPSLRGWCNDIGQYFCCWLKKQLFMYLLPGYVKNVPNRNFIKSHATLQWFHFAVVSLCNNFTLQWHNINLQYRCSFWRSCSCKYEKRCTLSLLLLPFAFVYK